MVAFVLGELEPKANLACELRLEPLQLAQRDDESEAIRYCVELLELLGQRDRLGDQAKSRLVPSGR